MKMDMEEKDGGKMDMMRFGKRKGGRKGKRHGKREVSKRY
jgi:hypothetical protein